MMSNLFLNAERPERKAQISDCCLSRSFQRLDCDFFFNVDVLSCALALWEYFFGQNPYL